MKSTIEVNTRYQFQMIDITSEVAGVVIKSGIKEGLAVVFVPHTTAGVTINENADPDVVRDLLYEINKIVPLEDNYFHGEGNSAAHLKSSFFGCSETVIIEDSKLVLGTWQSLYFCEFDGPRRRKFHVKVIEG